MLNRRSYDVKSDVTFLFQAASSLDVLRGPLARQFLSDSLLIYDTSPKSLVSRLCNDPQCPIGYWLLAWLLHSEVAGAPVRTPHRRTRLVGDSLTDPFVDGRELDASLLPIESPPRGVAHAAFPSAIGSRGLTPAGSRGILSWMMVV